MPNFTIKSESEFSVKISHLKINVACNEETTMKEIFLPDIVLLDIFKYLNCKELGRAGQVCWQWRNLANSEFIWKRRFVTDFNLKDDVKLMPGATSWREEYERLCDHAPSQELDKIEEHSDEVLHVAFSHNGMMFSTCSKDAYIKVYNADWPFETVFSARLGGSNSLFQWKYTQLSQFSPSDTQLLVSGRSSGSNQGGEIVIYNIFAGQFTLQSRVRIVPYDVMGTWLNETHILSAKAHILTSTLQCLCEVVLNKSSQDVEDLYQSTVTRTFLFRCNNLATVSYLLVADLTKPIKQALRSFVSMEASSTSIHSLHLKHLQKLPTTTEQKGKNLNIESQTCDKCNVTMPTEQNVKRMRRSSDSSLVGAPSCFSFCSSFRGHEDKNSESHPTNQPNVILKSCGIKSPETDSLLDSADRSFAGASQSSSLHIAPESCENVKSSRPVCSSCGKPIDSNERSNAFSSDIESSSAASADEELFGVRLPQNYKLFICFTGDLVCIPHQIGIKVLKQEECSKVADTDLKRLLGGMDRPELRADGWDHVLELSGQCVGMTLSPCNRYLYVNVRAWIGGWQDQLINNFREAPKPPKISTQIRMVVFDLVSMKQVATMEGHSAVSDVFFLHLSTNDLYVASGSEDSRGYIWDRHYNACVTSLPHDAVVNCVAVNPRDPSMAVSVSDDRTIKIWRSRAFHRLLNGARAKARNKFRFATCSSHLS